MRRYFRPSLPVQLDFSNFYRFVFLLFDLEIISRKIITLDTRGYQITRGCCIEYLLNIWYELLKSFNVGNEGLTNFWHNRESHLPLKLSIGNNHNWNNNFPKYIEICSLSTLINIFLEEEEKKINELIKKKNNILRLPSSKWKHFDRFLHRTRASENHGNHFLSTTRKQ